MVVMMSSGQSSGRRLTILQCTGQLHNRVTRPRYWTAGFGQLLTPEPLCVLSEDLSRGEPGASWEHGFSHDVLLIHRYLRVCGLFENPLRMSRKSGPFF